MEKVKDECYLTVGASYSFGKRALVVHKSIIEKHGCVQLLETGPKTIEIMPTYKCNQYCHFCSYYSHVISKGVYKNDEEQYKNRTLELLDEFKKGGDVKGIYISGGGEPTCVKKSYLVEIINKASSFAHICLQTNGSNLSMLDSKNLDKVNIISVSIIAHNEKLYRNMVDINSNLFEKIDSSIRRIIKIKKTNEIKSEINAKIIISNRNYLKLVEMYDYCQKLGFDNISVREVNEYDYGEHERANYLLTNVQKEELLMFSSHESQILRDFVAKIQSNVYIEPDVSNMKCFNVLEGHFANIDPEGNVSIGNPEIGKKDLYIGNIFDSKWKDIWRSPKHKAVIGYLNDKCLKGECDKDRCRHMQANMAIHALEENPCDSIYDDIDYEDFIPQL